VAFSDRKQAAAQTKLITPFPLGISFACFRHNLFAESAAYNVTWLGGFLGRERILAISFSGKNTNKANLF
jgi:hypothetical protein